ncbi:MAG: GNAT family N-acetyltransferase [Pseudonocardia sp.]
MRSPPPPTTFDCPGPLRPTAAARTPVLVGARSLGAVVQVSVDGMVLAPITAPWLDGDEVTVAVTVPFGAMHEVRGAVVDAGPDAVVVKWAEAPGELLSELAGYLLVARPDLTPARLRAAGLPVRNAVPAVTFGEALPGDADEVLELRLRSHLHDGHLRGLAATDLRSPFDAHARHIVCRHGERIVGYVRVIMIDGDPARSQYVTWSGHEVPARMWAAGFVEGGAGAVDPDYQRTGIFVPLMQRMVQVAAESGVLHLLGGCPDEHLDMYRSMGFASLEVREVEPRPGWRFRAHLLDLDLAALAAGKLDGRLTGYMRAAAELGLRRR